MNTFLPYADFSKSAQCLDYKRLGKQRVEAWQIYLALTKENYGWKNHPAVKMWKEHEKALLEYGLAICAEWINRGYKDSMYLRFFLEWKKLICASNKRPNWLDCDKFYKGMRSNLLRKDYNYYKQFKWKERNNLPYYWPV